DGTDLSSINLVFKLSGAPQIVAPDPFTDMLFAGIGVPVIREFSWNDIGGPDSPIAEGPLPGKPVGTKNTGGVPEKSADRDIKAGQEEDSQCFPGSMARSLDWLNRSANLGVNKTADKIYEELRDKVKNPAGADVKAKASKQIELKDQYAKDMKSWMATKVYD